jgi:hypothetical protein
VADVYGARVHIDGDRMAGAPELADGLNAAGVRAVAGGDLSSSVRLFVEAMPEPCAALVLGAGDVGLLKDELFEQLALCRSGERRPVR